MSTFNIKLFSILCLALSFSACHLGLQETYDFKSEANVVDPYEDMTAWEYIQTQTKLDDEGAYDPEQLHYLIAAIEKAGMIEEYNQTSTVDRTFLLLNNASFTGGGDVIQMITGLNGDEREAAEMNLSADEVMELVDTPEKLEKLQTILKYHIVTTYIDQVPTLATKNTTYIFQTLIPGENGKISFQRDDQWRIQINSNQAPLPPTSYQGGWNENVRSHNYVFSNGIGHYLNDPVRNQPY